MKRPALWMCSLALVVTGPAVVGTSWAAPSPVTAEAGVVGTVTTYADPTAGFPDAIFFKRLDRVDRDYALFAEGSYDFSPEFTLTAGIRGFKADNSLYGFSGPAGKTRQASCLPSSDPFYPCINVRLVGSADPKDYKETGETHKVSLAYKIDAARMIYATYSTGFRPGGNDRRLGTPSYLADTLTNFEVGWKTQWMGNHLRFNGALFHEKWAKIQFTLPGANGQNYLLNAPGGAAVYGVESDIGYYAGGLTLSAAGAYIDAHLADDAGADDRDQAHDRDESDDELEPAQRQVRG